MGNFENFEFESPEQMVDYIIQRADDFSEVTLSVASGLLLGGPEGQQAYLKGGVGLVMHVAGDSVVISAEAAEVLLNTGLLSRLRVPVRLLPLVATDDKPSQEGHK